MGPRGALVQPYYDQDAEEERLLVGAGPLEFLRTKQLLTRFLQPQSRIADVGGGTGRYAEWLSDEGHDVELVDPMPLHVSRAEARAGGRFAVRLGDARELPFADETFDAVLLLGPLYHLDAREERLRALHQAVRVCRHGGIVAAAAISRLAPLLGSARSRSILVPEVLANVRDESRSGRRVPPERRTGLFPDAYFHLPGELRAELGVAGVEVRAIFGVEGPAWLIDDFSATWADDELRARIVAAADAVEEDEHLVGLSPHLLAVAFRP